MNPELNHVVIGCVIQATQSFFCVVDIPKDGPLTRQRISRQWNLSPRTRGTRALQCSEHSSVGAAFTAGQ